MPKETRWYPRNYDKRPYPSKRPPERIQEGDERSKDRDSSPHRFDLVKRNMQIRDKLEHTYREIMYGEILVPAYPDYTQDAKFLGQCYAKQERLVAYQPSSDDLSNLSNSTKEKLASAIERYEKKFEENPYKELKERIDKYNKMVKDYNQTHPSNEDTKQFPSFETHQQIKERAKEKEKIRLDLLDERRDIMPKYEIFVRKAKRIGELFARHRTHWNKKDDLKTKVAEGGTLTNEEQIWLNVVSSAKKKYKQEEPVLEREIEPLDSKIQAYNKKVDNYNKDLPKDKKLLKLPDSDYWKDEAFRSISKYGDSSPYIIPHIDFPDSSEYERFQQYETDPSRSMFVI